MATIFPLSASVNQEFNGYVFDGDSWNAVGSGFAIEHLSDVEISSILDGDSLIYNSASSKWINQIPEGSSVTISSNPPEDPDEGDLWFDYDTQELFIYDSVYWVEVSGTAIDLSLYLTIANASATYLTQSNASLQYLTQSNASTVYQQKVSNVDDTEISYLNGVTSDIQSQINSKLNLSTASTTYLTISDPIVTGVTSINGIKESITLAATSASGTVIYNVLSNNGITYYTSNASANWTLNIRGDSGTTLNSIMNTGQSLTIAFAVTNGSTAYYQTSLQIDGSSVTPKWQGGSSPTSGNTNSIDVYSITIIKTGNATFTVWESQTKFT
jgi:hypothetical protein